ncbi:inositol-tetrakisphosphate 1-kinase-like [Achlya hypogyna]|uniref:Inositol-tetrakisphosphate 1-kinase n=1 Tax=Achlya hypogyna TaxID=1202772 RepID=A0A1V9YFN9_ACHHY|nr:inositol-tetrakisphosphate 1-kinase-like [Achlya hypogyna]
MQKEAPRPTVRVGVILPLKKTRNGRMQELLRSDADGVTFVHIDLDTVAQVEDIERSYGKLDVLLHKLAHDMIFETLGDETAIKNMRVMNDYIARHPHVRVVDPLPGVRLLTNRHAVCTMLADVASTSGLPFSVPKYRVVDSPAAKTALLSDVAGGGFSLPVIVKSLEACGTDASHVMQVLSQPEDVAALSTDTPLLFQEFVNHDARLFKGYVLGPTILVSERVSLPNLGSTAAKAVEFDTQSPFPTAAAFELAPTPQSTAQPLCATMESAMHAIGRAIQGATQLSLFGFDVIMESGSGRHMVIDVNYFPSFKELPDFDARMRTHMKTS